LLNKYSRSKVEADPFHSMSRPVKFIQAISRRRQEWTWDGGTMHSHPDVAQFPIQISKHLDACW